LLKCIYHKDCGKAATRFVAINYLGVSFYIMCEYHYNEFGWAGAVKKGQYIGDVYELTLGEYLIYEVINC
jgi:hypothetical protein